MYRTPMIALLLLASSACGSDAEPDPAALDRTLDNLIADQEAQRARLVEEARLREDQRELEMQRRAANHSGNAAGNALGNASGNAQ